MNVSAKVATFIKKYAFLELKVPSLCNYIEAEFFESAKLHVLRAYVPNCLQYLLAHALWCLACLRAQCLACLYVHYQRALHAYMSRCLCLLTCSQTNVSYMLTYSRANKSCVITCLRANVPYMLKWSTYLCVPMHSRAITSSKKNSFFNFFLDVFLCLFPVK